MPRERIGILGGLGKQRGLRCLHLTAGIATACLAGCTGIQHVGPGKSAASTSPASGCPKPAISADAHLPADPTPTPLPPGSLGLPPPPDTYPDWGPKTPPSINPSDSVPAQLLIHLANHTDSPMSWSYDVFIVRTDGRNRRYPGGVAIGYQPVQYQDFEGGIWDWSLSHCRGGSLPSVVVAPHHALITALDMPRGADHVIALTPGTYAAQVQLYRNGRPDSEATAVLIVQAP